MSGNKKVLKLDCGNDCKTIEIYQESLDCRLTVGEFGASLVVQMVKNLPTIQETQIQSMGQEDPLEKEIATHSSILAWEIPWMEDPSRLQSIGSQRVRHD